MAWDGLRHLSRVPPQQSPQSRPGPPYSCSIGLEPLISQLCPSKLSWLSARFVSSSHSGAKYLYYYCNYFPISIARGSGGQRGGPDKRIDGQAVPRGCRGPGRGEAPAAAKQHKEEQGEDAGPQGPLHAML